MNDRYTGFGTAADTLRSALGGDMTDDGERVAELLRAAISNAYYESRNEGQTMESAADRAVVDGLATLAADGLVVTTQERADIGEAVEAAGDDWQLTYRVRLYSPETPRAVVYIKGGRWGEGETVPEAIAAALEEQPEPQP